MSRSVSVLLVAALAAAALVACSSGSSDDPQRTIVGTWTGTVEGKERTHVFGPDGSFQMARENHRWAGTYEASGEAIVIHLTSETAGGLPVITDERYTGTFAIAADGESMTLSLQADPPPDSEGPVVLQLRRI